MLFGELSWRSQFLIVDAFLEIDRPDITDEDREEIVLWADDPRNFTEDCENEGRSKSRSQP